MKTRIAIVVGALGPKGREIARELGDGLFVALSVDEEAKGYAARMRENLSSIHSISRKHRRPAKRIQIKTRLKRWRR